jgi:glycine cleavage system H protein
VEGTPRPALRVDALKPGSLGHAFRLRRGAACRRIPAADGGPGQGARTGAEHGIATVRFKETSRFTNAAGYAWVTADGMENAPPKTLAYRRGRFTTRLPLDYLYSPSHAWAARQPDGAWRIGLTRFAVRMLGEMVDHAFELEPGAPVIPGQILGWVEGFKAISDLFSGGAGRFRGGNPELQERITLINNDPYGAGWLYAMEGQLDPGWVDVEGYGRILDRTIDRILAQQQATGGE